MQFHRARAFACPLSWCPACVGPKHAIVDSTAPIRGLVHEGKPLSVPASVRSRGTAAQQAMIADKLRFALRDLL